jgi:hypothetical protein
MIKSEPITQRIPIIALTENAMRERVSRLHLANFELLPARFSGGPSLRHAIFKATDFIVVFTC